MEDITDADYKHDRIFKNFIIKNVSKYQKIFFKVIYYN